MMIGVLIECGSGSEKKGFIARFSSIIHFKGRPFHPQGRISSQPSVYLDSHYDNIVRERDFYKLLPSIFYRFIETLIITMGESCYNK
jgi:hypothetical protein